MSATKVVCLDIDGVLNSTRYWWRSHRHLPMGQSGAIDPDAVARLNAIVEQTGAVVVLSSSWRQQGLRRVEGMLRERGYAYALLAATPVKLGSPRCAEIAEWLASAVAVVGPSPRVAILDDDTDAWHDDDFDAERCRYFPTNFQVGLTAEHVPLVVEWLNEGRAT